MSCKFYITDWIPRLGRYAIITSVFRKSNGYGYTYVGETFIFSLGKDTSFTVKRFTYHRNPKTEKAGENRFPVDETYMQKAALYEAKKIINQEKAKAYGETNDSEIYRHQWDPEECELWPTFALELPNKYQNDLKKLTEDSKDEDLKYMVSALLLTLASIGPPEENNRQ